MVDKLEGLDIRSAPVSSLCWQPVNCLTALHHCLGSPIRALHFAPTCSVNKGSLFLDAKAGPFTLGTPPTPCCRGRAGAELWGQREQPGDSWWPGRGVIWALILALLWDLGQLTSPLCVSVAPPARAGVVLGLLEHLETRALFQESEV